MTSLSLLLALLGEFALSIRTTMSASLDGGSFHGNEAQRQSVATSQNESHHLDVLHALHALAVDVSDDVTSFQPRLLSGTSFLHHLQHDAHNITMASKKKKPEDMEA